MTESSSPEPFRIYGASDDLVEVEGPVREEFNVLGGPWTGTLTAPNGENVQVTVEFVDGFWEITVTAGHGMTYLSWPVHFTRRPDYPEDPAVLIHAPEGTTLTTETE